MNRKENKDPSMFSCIKRAVIFFLILMATITLLPTIQESNETNAGIVAICLLIYAILEIYQSYDEAGVIKELKNFIKRIRNKK